jgi:hypothetical protein
MLAISSGMSQRHRHKGFFQLQSRRGPSYTTTFWRTEVIGCLGPWYAFPQWLCLHDLTPESVFAIQKCDPAPFYLFDEVGQVFQIASTEDFTGRYYL